MARSYEDSANREWARLFEQQQGLQGLLGGPGGTGAAPQRVMDHQSAYKQHVDQSKITARDEGIEKEKAEAQRVALLMGPVATQPRPAKTPNYVLLLCAD
jgi:hypothetical protein